MDRGAVIMVTFTQAFTPLLLIALSFISIVYALKPGEVIDTGLSNISYVSGECYLFNNTVYVSGSSPLGSQECDISYYGWYDEPSGGGGSYYYKGYKVVPKVNNTIPKVKDNTPRLISSSKEVPSKPVDKVQQLPSEPPKQESQQPIAPLEQAKSPEGISWLVWVILVSFIILIGLILWYIWNRYG